VRFAAAGWRAEDADRPCSAAGWLPRPDAAKALGCDSCDVSGRGIGQRREHNVGPEIGVGEALEDLGGTALGHARGAVHDEVFQQPPLVRGGRRDRESDAGVAAKVPQFPLVREGGKDDLVTIEPDPGGRDLRPSIFVKRDHVRNRVALEEGAGGLGERDASHGSMLAVGRVGPATDRFSGTAPLVGRLSAWWRLWSMPNCGWRQGIYRRAPRSQLVDAVLDLPDVPVGTRLEITLPTSDAEML